MNRDTVNFLINKFKKYYYNNIPNFSPIEKISNKEFAFIFWNREGMIRHTKLESLNDLKKFIINNRIFRHIYISGAYYKYPNATDMINKGWLGTNFIIDIDADHLRTPCKKVHDKWICTKCKKTGKGIPPKKCTCGCTRFQTFGWICDKCIEATKNEVFKFTEYFIDKFSIDKKNIEIHFSGHRGFHIIINSNDFITLRDYERREVTQFLQDCDNKQYNIQLDSPVSIDIHRLIRFVNSLHGKTGFKVQKIDFKRLGIYDPFKESIVFSLNNDVKIITTKEVPKFIINDTSYGTYLKNQKITVPECVAIFLMCKDVAEILK